MSRPIQTTPKTDLENVEGDDHELPVKRSGRRKIKIEYIEDKNRRHITFSKRKAGIMKKAYELSTLTGTQVLLLVVSETGLVYTFTTAKLQDLVTKPEGKNLIQSCLNAPEPSAQEPSTSAVDTTYQHPADTADGASVSSQRSSVTNTQTERTSEQTPQPSANYAQQQQQQQSPNTLRHPASPVAYSQPPYASSPPVPMPGYTGYGYPPAPHHQQSYHGGPMFYSPHQQYMRPSYWPPPTGQQSGSNNGPQGVDPVKPKMEGYQPKHILKKE
ncbi:transcription factor of the MADS box [Apophysomyces sp. BC1034]|nr:transcription factor of the MADS box [Apophysomyces sp. BC1015]KAG0180717.1 transcription factor of the MADS box [Apophysomyces sp. BC1021]KAG0191105.1 transcription factor of the MADS box [Apophysomyces sp. BC1034]